MPSVMAVGRERMAVQLGLTGVHVRHVHDVDEAEDVVGEILDDPGDTQVLVIEEELRPQFSELMKDRLRLNRGKPMVVYCPEFAEEDSDVDAYLASVIKPAVGYEIRLE